MNLIITFLLAHTLSTDHSAAKTERSYTPVQDTTYVVSLRDSVVDYAKTFLGKPYKYACASPATGFDCSGFTWFVFNHFNVVVPRSSKDYATLGTRVTLETCRKGDIMLFTGTNPKERRVGHVGIVISNAGEPVQFIHASSSASHPGVVITDYASSHYPERFMGVCSVLP
jgi:murein DD-endopeptidase / murein LD-carboxypeptidase